MSKPDKSKPDIFSVDTVEYDKQSHRVIIGNQSSGRLLHLRFEDDEVAVAVAEAIQEWAHSDNAS